LLAVEPAFRSVPAYHRTLGPEVADLARLAGFPPDPEQEMGLDAIFAVDERGLSVAFETAVICCRQNLKTGLFKQAALGWLFITDERLIVWSAHEFRTSQEAFRDLDELITGCDTLRRRVKHIYRGNGDEAIELLSGARVIFKTRTKGGGRGLSGRKVILDEAFALQPMHMGALLPTLSAQPDPQVLYGSSAGLFESAVLRGVRDRGRAGADRRLAYFEWCAPDPADVCADGAKCKHQLDAVGCGCDEPEHWQRANPAIGRRISLETISAERRALPPEEFGRERMGWWDDPIDPSEQWAVIPETVYRAVEEPTSQAGDRIAIALDATPDGSMAAIAIAGVRADGLGHCEVIDHRRGTGWIVDRIAGAKGNESDMGLVGRWKPVAVVVDSKGPAGFLIKPLEDRGVTVTPLSAGDVGTATNDFIAACGAGGDEPTLRILPYRGLEDAVAGADTSNLGDGRKWNRRNPTVDISPLVAVTHARHGLAMAEEEQEIEPWAAWT